jgi:arsenate reductase
VKILIICTGNSCRSQMAEAFLKSFDESLEIYSAGTDPAAQVHPMAIQVMNELGISLQGHTPKNVEAFLNDTFDFVITVCDHARETCPVFHGNVRHRLHMGFEDPAAAAGTNKEIFEVFRRVRDKIQEDFDRFYKEYIK